MVQNLTPPEMEWQQPDQAYGYEVCVKLSSREKLNGSIFGAIYTGWWYTYPSEKYEFVSWDDDMPNIWKVIKFHGSSHHQPDH